jgi:hypothetical protein
MKNNKQQKVNNKIDLKIHLIVFSVLTIIIVLDYLNIGLPCFF